MDKPTSEEIQRAIYDEMHKLKELTGILPIYDEKTVGWKEAVNWEKRIHEIKIAALEQMKPISGDTSDGYHTFNELYHHRVVLFSALCKAYPDKAWRSKKHSDGSMFGDDWFICGIRTPAGQYSYHYRISEYWEMFNACQTLDFAPEWDGHQPKDVDRLLTLEQMQTDPTPINWIEAQKAYSANGRKPVVLHDGLYEVEIRRSYDKHMQTEPCKECKNWESHNIFVTNYRKHCQDNEWLKLKNYCPNCGRKLEDT